MRGGGGREWGVFCNLACNSSSTSSSGGGGGGDGCGGGSSSSSSSSGGGGSSSNSSNFVKVSLLPSIFNVDLANRGHLCTKC